VSRLLDVGDFEHAAALVEREAAALLRYAQLEREKFDAACSRGDAMGQRVALSRLARIARQLTRAQAVLVHPDDPRAKAAAQVIGYCDEADRVPWAEPLPPVSLGMAS
jgi:hypothetical protein